VKFRFCSILAQIKMASCFRNNVEPIFQLIGRILPALPNPRVFARVASLLIFLPDTATKSLTSSPYSSSVESFGSWKSWGQKVNDILLGGRHRSFSRIADSGVPLYAPHWWLIAHHERVQGDARVSYPGETCRESREEFRSFPPPTSPPSTRLYRRRLR
jgi:hypothetical protein